ncbi:hypothetical protein AAG570_007152 [Ranatra chinensis]|uniref:Uncharacterized protein n=1 Tax=Ranatra chinensis TaxID=642074 RepID=A0ABD0XV18_9HEMI
MILTPARCRIGRFWGVRAGDEHRFIIACLGFSDHPPPPEPERSSGVPDLRMASNGQLSAGAPANPDPASQAQQQQAKSQEGVQTGASVSTMDNAKATEYVKELLKEKIIMDPTQCPNAMRLIDEEPDRPLEPRVLIPSPSKMARYVQDGARRLGSSRGDSPGYSVDIPGQRPFQASKDECNLPKWYHEET